MELCLPWMVFCLLKPWAFENAVIRAYRVTRRTGGGGQTSRLSTSLVTASSGGPGRMWPRREGLKLIGGLLVTISAVGSDGITRSGSHMCYISENVTRLFLSKKACIDLGIIGENLYLNLHNLNWIIYSMYMVEFSVENGAQLPCLW